MKDFWNERFSKEQFAYGTEPNFFFASALKNLEPGMLLLPGEGEGRNAVYAAVQGWEVYAVDYSEAGQEKAFALAESVDAELAYTIADLTMVEFEEEIFDAVGLVFVHLPEEARIHLHTQVIRSLKPGGHLILQAFSKDQLEYNSGGPPNIDLLFDTEILREDFKGMEIEMLEARIEELNEGPYHRGPAAVVNLLARKP